MFKLLKITKFHLKQIILICWTKFAQKYYFLSKARQLKITLKFGIFELIWVSTFNLRRQF